MDLKPLAKQYAEAFISGDINILRNIFAEHVRLFYKDRYIEGIFDVLAHIQEKFKIWQDRDNERFTLMNIYQDSDTVVVEFEMKQLKNTTLCYQVISIIKFDHEKIVNIHDYYNYSDVSEDVK